jgi:hypothetical protein
MAEPSMTPETQQALETVSRLARDLQWRQPDIRRFDDYYRGHQGKLRYASSEFADHFKSRYGTFSDNWCGVVADAPVERLEVVGFRLRDEAKPDEDLWRVWRDNDADFYSDQAFLDATISKRAFMMVWGNPADETTPRITWEHPAQAIIDYDPETHQRRSGLKCWVDDTTEYATLMTPTRIWKWQRSRFQGPQTESGLLVVGAESGWTPREVGDEPWPLKNPLGVVPMVELPNRPRLIGEPLSDIAGVVAMQDATNLFWSYLFSAADFSSFPARVITGAERPKIPILNDQGQVVGERPVPLEKFRQDRILWLEDPNAKIAEWQAANLASYGEVIEMCVSHTAAQSRTPPHYLMSRIVNANAETLKTAETGLVKRTEEKTKSYGRGIREGASLVALAQGDEAKARAMRSGTALWRDVETRSEAQAVDGAMKLHSMGFPLEYLAQRIGIDPDEITNILTMRREEATLDPLAELTRNIPPVSSLGNQADEELE